MTANALVEHKSTTPTVVKIGSATEFVDVPDLRKKGLALAGLTLAKEGATVPEGIRTGTEGKNFEMAYRAPVEGDPAVRRFRAGDTLVYRTTLFAPAGMQPTGEVQVLSDSTPVHSEPLAFKGSQVSGVYRINQETPVGRYFLGVTAEDAPGKRNGRATAQWIDFEVVK